MMVTNARLGQVAVAEYRYRPDDPSEGRDGYFISSRRVQILALAI